ncbi:MAG: biotin/lipoyl-containing protein, partial [Planctomycetota bacterium]
MSIEFRLPDLGEGVHEGEIVRVLVAEGDQVKEDQPLLEVETDKASVEIPSPHTGVVSKIHVAERQTVNVGEVLVTFGDAAGPAPAGVEVKASAPPPPSRGRAGVGVERTESAPSSQLTVTKPGGAKTKPASPAVRKLARKLGVDLASIEGSGPGGRVTREDVERAASGAPARPPPPAPDPWGPTHREPLTRARRTIAEAMVRSKSTIPHSTDTDDADITDLDHLRREHRSADKPDRKLSVLPFVIRATV